MKRLGLIFSFIFIVHFSFAQELVDHKVLLRKINWMRVTHLRPPLRYNHEGQKSCDEMALFITKRYTHNMPKKAIGEVIAKEYLPDSFGWKRSKGHKKNLLRYKAKKITVSVLKYGDYYYSVARIYR